MPASATFSEGENFLLKMQLVGCSVTRLGDLLHFGQLFKARGNNNLNQNINSEVGNNDLNQNRNFEVGNNNLTQIALILGNFCKGVEIFNFSCEIIFGQLYIHLVTICWSHWQHSVVLWLVISAGELTSFV